MTNIAKHQTETPTPPAPLSQWWTGPRVGIDFETTGVNTTHDRIVTASVIPVHPGSTPVRWEWLADPGVDIPAETTKIHTITTEQARTHGRPAGEVVAEICSVLDTHWTWGNGKNPAVPLVGFNVHFDLSLLAAETRRHLGRELHVAGPVIDPRILDKQTDRARTGRRNLGGVCEHYGVPLSQQNAHTSTGDALAALRLVDVLAECEQATLGQYTLVELHTAQAGWWQAQNLDKAAELERTGQGLTERAQQARANAADTWPITSRR